MSRALSIEATIDAQPLRPLQLMVVGLSSLVVMLDGFDVQAMAIATPVIAEAWGIERSAFGPVLSASLVGLMAGALAGGPLGDRIGRKPLILASFALVGLATLLTSAATGIEGLFLGRLATGIGLGGTLPNVLALTSEYMPRRHRRFLTAVILTGLPVGAAAGGAVSAPIVAAAGWEGIFQLGGIVPLLLVPVLWRLLPESMQFLARRDPAHSRAIGYLRAVAPTVPGDATLVPADAGRTAGSPTELFARGRAVGTLVLWAIFFFNLFAMYLLLSWLPATLVASGASLDAALRAVVAFNAGGAVGGFVLAYAADRLGPMRMLVPSYVLGAAAVAALGLAGSEPARIALVAAGGAMIVGAQFCINALAAEFYPSPVRATGLGWALGIGRLGAILSPLLGGAILGGNGAVGRAMFQLAAAPLLACAVALAGLGWWQARRRHAELQQEPSNG